MLFAMGVRKESCDCHRHAEQMDEWGPDECGRRVPEIVGWLREESRKRGARFSERGATALVRVAVWRSRR